MAPFVTKSATTLTLTSPVDGLPASFTTTPVSDADAVGQRVRPGARRCLRLVLARPVAGARRVPATPFRE